MIGKTPIKKATKELLEIFCFSPLEYSREMKYLNFLKETHSPEEQLAFCELMLNILDSSYDYETSYVFSLYQTVLDKDISKMRFYTNMKKLFDNIGWSNFLYFPTKGTGKAKEEHPHLFRKELLLNVDYLEKLVQVSEVSGEVAIKVLRYQEKIDEKNINPDMFLITAITDQKEAQTISQVINMEKAEVKQAYADKVGGLY